MRGGGGDGGGRERKKSSHAWLGFINRAYYTLTRTSDGGGTSGQRVRAVVVSGPLLKFVNHSFFLFFLRPNAGVRMRLAPPDEGEH